MSKSIGKAVIYLSLAFVMGCDRGATLPPLVEQEQPRLPGKFVWHNLITPDAEGARNFYGGLFGWEFDVKDGGEYTEVSYGGRHIGGIVDASKGEHAPRSSVWLNAVSVAELDSALAGAVTAGATQLEPATEIPGIGRAGVISDPGGAVLQLIASKNGDPPDVEPPTHTWLWHELISDDPGRVAGFYETVFGYEVEPIEPNEAASYHVLRATGIPRAGIVQNPFEQTRSTWIPYIRVDDPASLLSKVVQLGGQVVFAPREDLRDGTLALVLDPAGAPVALQKWTPPNERQGS